MLSLRLRTLMLPALLLSATACAQLGPGSLPLTQPPPSTSSTSKTVATEPLFCAEYHPVQWSTRDTDLTKSQVQANNALFHKLCP